MKAAVDQLCKPYLLDALFALQQYVEWLQGTSPNETFHSYLKKYMRVTGGNRSYEIINIGLCLAMWKFNLPKLKAGQSRGGEYNALHSAAIDAALDFEGTALLSCKLRQSWKPAMQSKFDLETLLEMGFKPARGTCHSFSQETLELLYEGFLSMVNGGEFIHVRDPWYYVQHHLAQRTLTRSEVRKLMHYVRSQIAAASVVEELLCDSPLVL